MQICSDLPTTRTDGIMTPAIPDRKRRCMSRRSGQNGSIERKGNVYYARFWLDVPGEAKRVNKSVSICPVNGPGSLNEFELKRRLKEIIAEFDANAEVTLRETEAVNLGTTFKQQAERLKHTGLNPMCPNSTSGLGLPVYSLRPTAARRLIDPQHAPLPG